MPRPLRRKTTMRADPPRGKTCAECGKTMPTVTDVMRTYSKGQIDRDPFCRTACARAYHHVTFKYAPTSSVDPHPHPEPLNHAIGPRELPLPAGGPGT